jgi:membrane-associated phospholipid phosphatase
MATGPARLRKIAAVGAPSRTLARAYSVAKSPSFPFGLLVRVAAPVGLCYSCHVPAASSNAQRVGFSLRQAPIDSIGGAILTTAGTAAFVTLARRAATGTISAREERSFRMVNGLPNGIRVPVWLVMQSGSLAAVGAATLVARSRSRRAAVGLAVAGTTAWALAKVAKPLVGRGRPADLLGYVNVRGANQSGLGFPSGHAAVAAALAVAASRALPNHGTLAAAVVAAVGGARQYVGAHLPLDVAGGIALGATVGAATNLALDGLLPCATSASSERAAGPAVCQAHRGRGRRTWPTPTS